MGLVLNVCDYIYVLDFGRIIAEGTSAEIRKDPAVIARLPRRDGRGGAGQGGDGAGRACVHTDVNADAALSVNPDDELP